MIGRPGWLTEDVSQRSNIDGGMEIYHLVPGGGSGIGAVVAQLMHQVVKVVEQEVNLR